MREPWVAGHLTGGLGNRLFQHAAAAGLAEKWGRQLVFYVPACSPTNHGPFHSIFTLFPSIPVLTEEEPSTMIPEAQGHVFTYSAFPDSFPPFNVCVDGWRQSPRYFPLKPLIPDFSGVDQTLSKKYSLESSSERSSTVFVHVRLGDYLQLPHHQIHIEDYYMKALQHIPLDKRILLFSDGFDQYEPHLVALFARLGRNVLCVKESDEVACLYLMSLCWGGAVVANSTFSWWGAWFAHQSSPEPETFVGVYPKVWGQGLPPARDIIPKWGIAIDNRG